MDTQDFLELVMPSEGKKIIGLQVVLPEGRKSMRWLTHKTHAQAAKTALKLDADGETVYFGVNSFGDWYTETAIKNGEEVEVRRIRTQTNVVACRSLFDDFDVDPQKNAECAAAGKPPVCYDTREEAMAGIVKLAQALRLTPTIVSSGGGYHFYITMDEDFTSGVWDELSDIKRDIMFHLGLRGDPSVDKDVSRILRPVGVHNRKTDTPRPVEVVKVGKVYSLEKVRERLETYARENNVEPSPKVMRRSDVVDNPFGAAFEPFPPTDANKIAENCAAVRQFRDTGGKIPEPHWHRAIGVLRFCENGEVAIHEWSSGYDGYSQMETQDKIDNWAAGPTSCIQMDLHTGCRENCPFKDKVKYPSQLGFMDDAPSVAEDTTAQSADTKADDDEDEDGGTPSRGNNTVIEGQSIPYWPANGFRWNGSALSRAVLDDDNVVHWRPFCKSFVYPINRIKDADGLWVTNWRAKEKNGSWREFFMPTAELASTDMMAKTMAANEVFLMRTRNARNDMAEFAEGLIETLQAWRVETKTYKQFGWNDDYTGFVMGTKMITLKGEEDVLCDPTIPGDVTVEFEESGTLAEWVTNINTLYNRPRAEPYQFALCHSMGSILVDLFGSSNWHGIPLAFTGAGSTGKTTACSIAVGFYGNPTHMVRQAADQGSTLNAIVKRIAVTGSLPLLLDEFSGRSAEDLTRTAYALANGRDKERLTSSGRFAGVGGEWFKNSFITSNDSLHGTISTLSAGHKVEATQLRFFEVKLPKGFKDSVFPDVRQNFVEHHMNNVYGVACRPFIRFVIKNLDWVKRQIMAARDKFNPSSEDDSKERFYRDAIVTALVAGKIAEKLGLISFDVANMKKWAMQEVLLMRDSRRESNTDLSEHLAQFISALYGRLIITRQFAVGSHKEAPMEILRGTAVGRVALDDKVAYVSVKAVAEWCKDNGVSPTDLRDEMDKKGYISAGPDGSLIQKIYLGQGTTMASAQQRCYEINYHKLFDGKALSLVHSGAAAETKSGEKANG